METMRHEVVTVYFQVIIQLLTGMTKENQKQLRQCIRLFGWNSNHAPPKGKCDKLPVC